MSFSLSRKLSYCAAIILCSLGCERDVEAPTATFLAIPAVTLEASAAEGGSTQDISEVWVYVDTQFVGAYHPPTEFPLLLAANATVELFAGIRQNGSGSDIAIYPFYSSYQTTVLPGVSQMLQPAFSYKTNVRFAAIDDFEQTNALRTDLDGDPSTSFARVQSENNGFAMASVSPEATQLEVETTFSIGDLPNDGRPFYLEMDYYIDTDLQIGLRKNDDSVYLLQLLPNNDWRKAYIDLSDFLRGSTIQDFQLRFRAQHDGSTEAEQHIRLDNLKLVHFPS